MMLPAALRTNRGTGEEGQRRNNNNKHITTPMMTSNPKKKNNHHDHKKDKHGKNKNKNKKKQARTNNGGMTPQPQQTTTTTNTTLTTVDPAKIEVHNISIQHGFKNRVPLPPINVWSRVLDKGSFLTAVLSVCVKRKAFFFDRRLATGFFTCVLSRQGHLVVYTEDGNEGFALNLRKASKLHIEFNKEKALPPPGEPPKRTCTVTAKWRFGSIVLQFQDRKMAEWCYAIVAATALDQGFPPAPRFVQSLGTGLLRVPPAEILMQPTTIPNDAAHQEHPKKMLQAHPIREETTKKKNEEAVTKEGKKKQRDEEQEILVGAARKLKDTAGLAPTSLSEDFPASIISDSDAEDVKEDGLADSKGVNSAEEDHKLDGSGLEEEDNDHIGNEPSSDRQEDEEEAEYWQRPESVGEEKTGEKKIIEEQQKEEEKAKKPPPPTPLKRRVTFSSQKTIIDKEEEKNASSTSGGPAPAMAESDSEMEPAWESFEEKTPEYRATTSAGLAKYQRHPRTGFTPAAAETTEQSPQQPNSFRTRRAPFDFRRIDDIDDEW